MLFDGTFDEFCGCDEVGVDNGVDESGEDGDDADEDIEGGFGCLFGRDEVPPDGDEEEEGEVCEGELDEEFFHNGMDTYVRDMVLGG